MTGLADFVRSARRRDWRVVPMWTLFRRVKRTGFADEELLSVYREHGVIPTSSRDDNHNKPSLDLSGYQLVEPGDLATNKMKTWQGSIAISRYRGIVSPAYFIYRPTQQQHDQYLHYLLRSQPYVAEYGRISKGVRVNQWDLDEAAFRALPVPFPDLPTQKAIAAFLDRETARIDQLIEKKQRLVELLGEKLTSEKVALVTRGLDPEAKMAERPVEWLAEAPAHWSTVRMAAIFHEVDERGKEGLPILSVSINWGISDRELGDEDRHRIVNHIADRSAYKRVQTGDLVYNMMRAWQGAFGVSSLEGLVSPAYVVARPRRHIHSPFFEPLLRTPMCIEEFRRASKGIADFRQRLYWEHFRQVRVVLPPLEEQEAIARQVAERDLAISRVAAPVGASIDRLKEYRSAVITAAVTGQIDVAMWSRRGEGDRRLDRIAEEMAG